MVIHNKFKTMGRGKRLEQKGYVSKLDYYLNLLLNLMNSCITGQAGLYWIHGCIRVHHHFGEGDKCENYILLVSTGGGVFSIIGHFYFLDYRGNLLNLSSFFISVFKISMVTGLKTNLFSTCVEVLIFFTAK